MKKNYGTIRIGNMTGDKMEYKYIGTNSPEQKINYSYSKYGGEAFLKSYRQVREDILSPEIHADNIQLNEKSEIATERLFNDWISNLERNEDIELELLNLLLKRFEVTKKIYEKYDRNFRPYDKTLFHNHRLYVLFAYVLSLSYKKYRKLQFLNSLLKVNDIIISFVDMLDETTKIPLLHSVQNELKYIDELIEELR